MQVSKEDIIKYYDFSKLDYQLYNLAFSNISMHFGLWDENVKSHKEALLNENKVLAQLAGVTTNDHVLDVGCGYGTTCIWLTKNIGCKTTGITISEKQVREAKESSKRSEVSHRTHFEVMDFHKIDFADNTFDAAIAIESICHSSKPNEVLKEIYRVLKPEGRLAIADGYFAKNKADLLPKEQEIANICFEGVHVPPLPERQEFENWLKATKFRDVVWHNKTYQILTISKKISRYAKIILPISKVFGYLGLRSFSAAHVKAFINQYYAWRDGVGTYGIFCAKK